MTTNTRDRRDRLRTFIQSEREETPKPRRRRRRRDESREEVDTDMRYNRQRRGAMIGQAPNPNFDKVRPKIDNHGHVSQRHNR